MEYIIKEGDSQDTPSPKFISKLGTVVYSNLIFNKGKIIKDGETVDTWDDLRLDDVLMSVTQAKELVETKIQGKDGTVVEYIGLDNYQIQIDGRITGAYNVYEKEIVKELKKILTAGQPLEVTSWYLQNLDITDIIVKDYTLPQLEGEYSTQYFSISAMSNTIIFADLITNQ